MSIHYTTGTKRLVYSSRDFVTGLTVTGYIWDPSLTKSALQIFTEVSDSFYVLDYNFASYGIWFGKFYENGVGAVGGVFNVVDASDFGVFVFTGADIINLSSHVTVVENLESPVDRVVELNSFVT